VPEEHGSAQKLGSHIVEGVMSRVLLALTIGLLGTADGAAQDKEKAAAAIHGSWKGVAAEVSGSRTRLGSDWEIQEGKITETSAQGKGEWKYRIDPKKMPKEIDLTPSVGPLAGKTLKGIYTVEGDILKVCYRTAKDPKEQGRPREFTTKKGDDLVLLTFQRVKP
jgi:uncharacterized protein (TIGR03067 family)